MPRNIDQFNIFAAKILDTLHDSFPVPIEVRRAEFAASLDVQAWLRRIDEAASAAQDSANPFARAEAAAEQSKAMTSELQDRERLKSVFSGTMQFLIAEGFVRYSAEFSDAELYRGCQLTGKGLLHLKHQFADKKISQGKMSVIDWLKSRVLNASSLEGAVAVQLLGAVIGRFLVP